MSYFYKLAKVVVPIGGLVASRYTPIFPIQNMYLPEGFYQDVINTDLGLASLVRYRKVVNNYGYNNPFEYKLSFSRVNVIYSKI